MFIKTIVRNNGMTLMSVMVATALSGIVGLMVIRLMGNQAEAMLIVKLREEREILIKHYRQVIIGGWDYTLKHGAGSVYTRGGNPFPAGGLILKSDDLYRTTSVSDGWWKVIATIRSETSGQIQHSDAYSGTTGLHQEQNYTVTLRVEFDPKKHPVVSMKLATRAEVIYIGQRWQKGAQTGCGSDSETTTLTRRDTTGTTKPLYHPNTHSGADDVISGQGAIVSYSLHSNYVKCSQVPLVSNVGECPPVGAILGFESWEKTSRQRYYRKNHTTEYVTGRLACSYPDENYPSANNNAGSAWKAALPVSGAHNERYYTLHRKVWDKASTPAGSGANCLTLNKSYVDSVTAITAPGTGGGELVCEPNLIAPHKLNQRVTGNSISGCTSFSSSGYVPSSNCNSYTAWNGVGNYVTYTYHAGGGGYQTGKGISGIRSVGHSGGIKEFNSTGSAIKIKPHPILANNSLRGRPGRRGDKGTCACKDTLRHTTSTRWCKLP